MGLDKLIKKALIFGVCLSVGCGFPGRPNPDATDETAKSLSKSYLKIINQYKTGNVPIVKNSDPITLGWENGSSNIEVLYRQRFTQNWTSLGVATGINPAGTSQSIVSGLAPGIYDFSIYDHDPQVNILKTSLDPSAIPASGWFIMYKKSPEADANHDGKISDSEMKSFIDAWQRKKYTNQQFSVNADFYLSQK